MTDPTEITHIVQQHDPLAVPCFMMGASLANMILYAVAATAYFRPISMGRTYHLIASVLAGCLLMEIIALIYVAIQWPVRAPQHGQQRSGTS